MKCPACESTLSGKQIGSIGVEWCETGCGGIWFDTLEMDRVDEDTDAVGELLFTAARGRRMEPDPARPWNCPRCENVHLKRVLLSPGSQVHIHECPSCDGCWLDEAALAKLHDERVDLIESGLVKPAGSADLIHYLYEVRTGRKKRQHAFSDG